MKISKYGEEDITGNTLDELTELFDEFGKFGSDYADSKIIAKIKELKEVNPRFNYLFSIASITDSEEDELYKMLIEYLGPLMQEAVEKKGYYMYFE
uniref:Uncharacterized protein n=1 Tax=Strigamia maritima TaxID=126957 RepID=T1JDE5_STRMM